MDKIVVLGDGAWGTTLSIVLSEKIKQVFIWGVDTENLDAINKRRENPKFLPGVFIPENIRAVSSIPDEVRDYLLVVPSKFVRDVLLNFKELGFATNARWCIATKGIDPIELKTMSQILHDVFSPEKVAVISGPAIAREVVSRRPTALVVASRDISFAKKWQDLLSNRYLRFYRSQDVVGVELCGSLKNIFAIGAGICDGLDLGTNAKSAFITRALVEMSRFVLAMGGTIDTVYGITGLGDLVTTCFSLHSRNRGFGQALGCGVDIEKYLSSSVHVVEGVSTIKAVVKIARNKNIEMPIVSQIYDVIFKNKPAKEAIVKLMTRPLKEEKILL